MGQTNTKLNAKKKDATASAAGAGDGAAAAAVDAKAQPRQNPPSILMLGHTQSNKFQHACVLANDHKEVSLLAHDVLRVAEHNGQRLKIWNTVGQERFHASIPGVKGADCVLFCPRSLEEFTDLLEMAMPDLTGGTRVFAEPALSAEQQELVQLAANANRAAELLAAAEAAAAAAAAPAAAPAPPPAPQIRCRSAFVVVDPNFFPTDQERMAIVNAAGQHGLLTLSAPTAENRVAILETIAADLQLSETARLAMRLERAYSYYPGNPARNPAINAALDTGLPVAELRAVVSAFDFKP